MGSHLVEVENQIEFANVIKEGIWYRMREPGHFTCYQGNRTENLDEEMNSLKIGKLVIVGVYADTEK